MRFPSLVLLSTITLAGSANAAAPDVAAAPSATPTSYPMSSATLSPTPFPTAAPTATPPSADVDESVDAATQEQLREWLIEALVESSDGFMICEPSSMSCVAMVDDDAPSIPALDGTDERTVRAGLAPVLTIINIAPNNRPRLNANVVPQLFGILTSTTPAIRDSDDLKLRVIDILNRMGRTLTPAHRQTARTRLNALVDTSRNPLVVTDARRALTTIGTD